jgi:hypothetical protein
MFISLMFLFSLLDVLTILVSAKNKEPSADRDKAKPIYTKREASFKILVRSNPRTPLGLIAGFDSKNQKQSLSAIIEQKIDVMLLAPLCNNKSPRCSNFDGNNNCSSIPNAHPGGFFLMQQTNKCNVLILFLFL